jgi:uncharacterized protein
MRAVYKWLMKWTRTLHIYISMFALLALFFFAATGFMLNHEAWFGFKEPQPQTVEGDLPPDLVAASIDKEAVDKFHISERLRAATGASGLVDSFEVEDDTVRVVFRSPGRLMDVTIERETGHFKGEHDSRGLAGRLTDLHKGANAGGPWGLIIDGVSILLLFISLTGLVLWLSLKKRILIGVVAVFLGTATLLAIYFVFVP